jgi:ubiquinone/menaquinone biosynthesis C-methylase UbiE
MSAQQNTDRVFSGSIPQLYERDLVPLIFQHYADDLALRVAAARPRHVLEIAAGTGVLTRALAACLPAATAITATDLNPAMLEHAQRVGTARPVHWQTADAGQLQFDGATFDAVVAQFGVMFFPDKVHAFREVRRVLQSTGTWHFSVWGPIETNVFAERVTRTLAQRFPSDPPRFLARTPHGHADASAIETQLAQAGFAAPPRITTLTAMSRAPSARAVAVAYCQGTPLRNEIETRAPGQLEEITVEVTAALEREFGADPVEAQMQAIVIEVTR